MDDRIPASGNTDQIAVDRGVPHRRRAGQCRRRRRACGRARTRSLRQRRSAGRRRAALRGSIPPRRLSGAGRRSLRPASPAAWSASAVAYALSLFVNTTARVAGAHRIPVDVDPRRSGEQRAGKVVVRIGDAAFVLHRWRARPRWRGPSTAAARGACAGGTAQMVGDALDQADEVAVVVAERRGARQQRDVGHGRRDARARASIHAAAGFPSTIARRAQQAARRAPDSRRRASRAARLRRGRAPRRAPRVRRRSPARRSARTGARSDRDRAALPTAHAGGVADHVLVAEPPASARRPHERLVVETGRHEARRKLVDRRRRRSAPTASSSGSSRRGPRRVPASSRAHWARCARRARAARSAFGSSAPAAYDAARPVILEAAADEVHAVGEQRRGERVACIALVRHAVVGETKRPRSGRRFRRREGDATASPRGSGRGASSRPALARMSCVRVSRRTLNQRRQPALCSHNSSCGPAGLSRR